MRLGGMDRMGEWGSGGGGEWIVGRGGMWDKGL